MKEIKQSLQDKLKQLEAEYAAHCARAKPFQRVPTEIKAAVVELLTSGVTPKTIWQGCGLRVDQIRQWQRSLNRGELKKPRILKVVDDPNPAFAPAPTFSNGARFRMILEGNRIIIETLD
jgi:hypothetical protein